MNNNFIKWLSITCIYIVAIFCVEYSTGVLTLMAANDLSKISYALWGLFGFGCLFAGWQCLNEPDPRKLHLKRVSDLSNIGQVMGLLGTVIGLALMFSSLDLTSLDASDQGAITAMMGSIVSGLATAFYTTILGVVISVLLWVYSFVIAYYGSGFLYVKVKK